MSIKRNVVSSKALLENLNDIKVCMLHLSWTWALCYVKPTVTKLGVKLNGFYIYTRLTKIVLLKLVT